MRPAHADDAVEVFLTVQPADQSDPKQVGKPPSIEATLVGAQKTTTDKIWLSTTSQNQKLSIQAHRLREYSEGTETIAIAFVINGQEIWVGNDHVETDDNAKYAGVLENLEAAIDKLDLGKSAPAGSKGIVVSYSQGSEIKVPMGDLKLVTGASLGSQKDYRGKIGTDMASGISMGLAELTKVSTQRKALIVIGDGNDTNNDVAKAALAESKRQAIAQHVQLFAIIYKSAVSTEGAIITTMIPGAKTTNSIEGINSELNSILARMANRYYVTFAGLDEKTGVVLPWDGKEHELVVKVDQTELDSQPVTLGPKWAPAQRTHVPWLVVMLVVLGIVLVVVIIKRTPHTAQPPQMVSEPMPAPEAPRVPLKTAMMSANNDQDGFPIVGWLVPMNGVSAFQTWRLKPGLTKIGTAAPSDVIVNDGFMSTEHCEIASSPAGFTLRDRGSTNGCYVNEKKVQEHDLFDNDMILLGKTKFTFKSIN